MHLTSRSLELSSADTERAVINNYSKLNCLLQQSDINVSVQVGVLNSFYRMETLMGVFQAIKMIFLVQSSFMQWSRAANRISALS